MLSYRCENMTSLDGSICKKSGLIHASVFQDLYVTCLLIKLHAVTWLMYLYDLQIEVWRLHTAYIYLVWSSCHTIYKNDSIYGRRMNIV